MKRNGKYLIIRWGCTATTCRVKTDINSLIFNIAVCCFISKVDSAFGHYFRLWSKHKCNYKSKIISVF